GRRTRLLQDRQGRRHTVLPWLLPTAGYAANNWPMWAPGRRPPPQPRKAVLVRLAGGVPWLSAPPPIPAGALRVQAASGRAVETVSWRCPSGPWRRRGRWLQRARTLTVPADMTCDVGAPPRG